MYISYVPALNAFMNAETDKVCKNWADVVAWFFLMNKDTKMSSMSSIAELFTNAIRPNNFRINVEVLQPYFFKFSITSKTLQAQGFVQDVHFIEDQSGLRLTFSSMSKLIVSKGDEDLNDSFEFIQKVFQMYRRYVLAIGKKTKINTHWTLIERVSDFKTTMKPHEKKNEKTFKIMDQQPRVFTILKGSYKSLSNRLNKLEKDTEVYVRSDRFRIYETVVHDLEIELSMIREYIKNTHLLPYRQKQLGDIGSNGKPNNSIAKTKCNLHVSKSHILIDAKQNDFTPDTLASEIDAIRNNMQLGVPMVGDDAINSLTIEFDPDNHTDLEIFKRTKGKFIDDFQSLELIPWSDDNSIISCITKSNSMANLDTISDNNSVEEEDPTPEEDNQYSDYESDLEAKTDKPSPPRGRTQSSVSIRKVAPVSAIEDRETAKSDDEGYSS